MARQFPFGLEPKLPAGGVDVVAFLAAKRGGGSVLFQRGEESLLNFLGRPRPRQVFDLVIGDEIHFGAKATGEVMCKAFSRLYITNFYSLISVIFF